MKNRLPIYGFMHCCAINNYRDIVQNQWNKIFKSGLYDATENINMSVLGKYGNQSFSKYPKKVLVRYVSENLKEYEFPTLKALYDKCLKEDCIVWYIHTKGVANRRRKHPKFGKRDKWRNILEFYTISCWKYCVKAISCDRYETCGPYLDFDRLSNRGKFYYYGGNFWWSTSSYIRGLNDPLDCDIHNRWMAEGWLLGKRLSGTKTAIDIEKYAKGKCR